MYTVTLNACEMKRVGKTSQYSGVCWIKHMNRWGADIIFKKQHKKSYHANEIEAARRVNQYCDDFGINRRNPDVDSMPNKGVIQNRLFTNNISFSQSAKSYYT